MKGYLTQAGFMGLVNGKFILFPTESEYYDFIRSK